MSHHKVGMTPLLPQPSFLSCPSSIYMPSNVFPLRYVSLGKFYKISQNCEYLHQNDSFKAENYLN